MLAVTHLVLVLLFIVAFRLDRVEAFAVLLFGVFIDLDHILGMFGFVTKVGWSHALSIDSATTSGVQWKSLIHSPEGAFFVLPVVAGFRLLLPAVAWALHLAMDYVQMNFLGIASVPEMILLAAMCILLLFLENRNYRDAGHAGGLPALLAWETDRVMTYASGLPVIRSIRSWRGPRGTSG